MHISNLQPKYILLHVVRALHGRMLALHVEQNCLFIAIIFLVVIVGCLHMARPVPQFIIINIFHFAMTSVYDRIFSFYWCFENMTLLMQHTRRQQCEPTKIHQHRQHTSSMHNLIVPGKYRHCDHGVCVTLKCREVITHHLHRSKKKYVFLLPKQSNNKCVTMCTWDAARVQRGANLSPHRRLVDEWHVYRRVGWFRTMKISPSCRRAECVGRSDAIPVQKFNNSIAHSL